MLDVHPAHHAANTWRDFFIHIATIVLGLLIAVSLEQQWSISIIGVRSLKPVKLFVAKGSLRGASALKPTICPCGPDH